MKRAIRFGIVLLALAALTAAAASADGTNSIRSASETAQAPRKTKLERLAEKMLPQQKVDEALADAKAMKIPPKYEAKKAEYLKMFEAFVLATKLYVQLGK